MIKYFIIFLMLIAPVFGAVTDIHIPQRDTSTTFQSIIITGSSNLNELLGFDGSGVLVSLADINPVSIGATTPGSISATTLTATGAVVSTLSPRITHTDLAAGTVLTVGMNYYDTLTAIRTLTFSGSPSNGDGISLQLTVTGGPHILTIPTSYRVGTSSTTTTINLPTGNHLIRWTYINSTWVMTDSGVDTEAAYTVYGNPTSGALAPVMTASPIVTNLTVNSLLTLPQSDDPDVSAAGNLTWDTDGWLRAYDGTNQVAVGRKIESIQVTVILPNDLADSERDAFWAWSNESGMDFVITGWKAWSDTDDTTLNIETIAGDGSGNATVDAVEIATNGTGTFTGSDTTITAATIANGSLIVLDFDDTDTPGQVKLSIQGYYNANVN